MGSLHGAPLGALEELVIAAHAQLRCVGGEITDALDPEPLGVGPAHRERIRVLEPSAAATSTPWPGARSRSTSRSDAGAAR